MAHSPATNEHILNRADMINKIADKIGATTYLEIGVQTGKTFRAVKVGDKTGVDPDPKWKDQTHIMGSDQFFDLLEDDEKFDIIFIDGLHQWQQVSRDLANSIDHLADGGVILVDDCAPKVKAYQTRQPTALHWTGDVWRAWLRFRSKMVKRGWFSRTYDVAFGLGVLHNNNKQTSAVAEEIHELCARSCHSLTYEEFEQNFDALLDFKPVQKFIDDLNEWG